MKTKAFSAIAFVVILFVFTGCKDKVVTTYTANTPVYMSYETLRSSVSTGAARNLETPGKIYFKDNLIFINEQQKGIHVIDNSNPSSPVFVSFVNIPGNVDIAIKNNYLYADSYIDLVVLDITNTSAITEVKRVQNVFPYTTPAPDFDYQVAQIDESLGVVSSWVVKEISETSDMQSGGFYYFGKADMAMSENSGGVANDVVYNPNSVGVAGSMARFTISHDHLYTIDNQNMHVFDLANASSPIEVKEMSIGWTIETIFPNGDNLFIGSQSGMFIYSITTASNPTYVGEFSHATSCDPVVFADGYAYVTLRGGNACGGFENQLDVINASNLSSPTLLKSYALTGPYGLGIEDNTLFVCDGDAGLKIYDISDKMNIDQHLISHFQNINTYDVIPLNGLLLMIGADGLYQYDYSDLNNLIEVSHITVP